MELRSLKQDDSISVDDYGSISDYHGPVLVTSPRSDHPTPTAADDQLPVSLWTKLMSGKLVLHLGLLYRDNVIIRTISAMLITTKIRQRFDAIYLWLECSGKGLVSRRPEVESYSHTFFLSPD